MVQSVEMLIIDDGKRASSAADSATEEALYYRVMQLRRIRS